MYERKKDVQIFTIVAPTGIPWNETIEAKI